MNAFFEKDYVVDSRDTDLFGMLRPSALLGDLQDLATLHAAAGGISRNVLVEKYNAFWMLARTWYHLDRPVYAGQTLHVRTSHRGAGGAVVYRDFDLSVDGQMVGEAVTAWVVATLDTRTMLRPAHIAELVASPVPDVTKKKNLGHIKTPADLKLMETRRVRYSDTDVNGHMNNTRYADVACDAVAYENMTGQFVSDLRVNYVRECFAGQELQIFGAPQADGWFVRGADEKGESHFDMTLGFAAVP